MGYIDFPRKPSHSASFLHWIFLLSYPHSITLYIFDKYVNSRQRCLPFEYPGSAGAGPWQFIIIIGNLFCALLMLNHLILKIIPMVSNIIIPISQRSNLRHRMGRYLVKVTHPETWRSQDSVSVRLQSPVSCINWCRPAWQSTVDQVAKVKKSILSYF